MATVLRQVLDHFEQGGGSVSLPELAHTLGIERGMLQNMLDYWVHKGKLREVNQPACSTCGGASGCPFVMTMPRMYELVGDDAQPVQPPACDGFVPLKTIRHCCEPER